MNKATDPILELLEESDLALPPGAIGFNLRRISDDAPSQPTVDRAVQDLREYGLIDKPDSSKTYYTITDKGRAYLDGELDASEVESDEEN